MRGRDHSRRRSSWRHIGRQTRGRNPYAIVLTSVGIGTAHLAGTGTARADAPTVVLQINDLQITEPWGTSTQATFTISLDAPAPGALTVRARTFDGSAVRGQWYPDYVAKDTVVTFPPASSRRTFR